MKDVINVLVLANDYNEEEWVEFSSCFSDFKIPEELQGLLPDDIMRTLLFIVKEENILDWINSEKSQFGDYTPLELKEVNNGLKALKTLIMKKTNLVC